MGLRVVAAIAVVATLAASAAYLVARGASGGARAGNDRTMGVAPAPDLTPLDECVVDLGARQRALSSVEARAATSLIAYGMRHGVPEVSVARALDRAFTRQPGFSLGPRRTREVFEGLPKGPPSPDGLALVRALDGTRAAALTCRYVTPDRNDQRLEANGLTPRANELRRAFVGVFGRLPMGGFAPGGVDSGHVDGSSHYEGRAIDVFFRPASEPNQRRGWVFANWLTAHAEQYSVLSVIYDDHIWTVWASAVGWRDYLHPSGDTTDPVLRHLDHVHVAVVGGPWHPQ
ncbi:MAG: hypothetical protein ACRDPK_03290 [Carbonactinosporaceae bacterium]